jgi:hypothetical protein
VRLSARLGLLGALIAVPLGAALVGHVFGQDPAPAAPAEVRIGGLPEQMVETAASSAVAVPRPAPGQQSAQPEVTPTTLAGVVPPAPPVVAAGSAETTTGDAESADRGKDKGRSSNATSHPVPSPPTTHTATGRNG